MKSQRARLRVFPIVSAIVLFFLESCVMHSNVQVTTNKRSVILSKNNQGILDSLRAETILGNQISLDQFMNNRRTIQGSYFISLINYTHQTYAEGRFKRETPDSVFLDVVISDIEKSQLNTYEIAYRKDRTSMNLLNIYSRKYRISVKDVKDSKESKSTHNDLIITKSANFEIEKGILQLYTGEVESESGVHGKFVILNDPLLPIPVYASVWYILLAGNEDFDCNEKLKEKCGAKGLKLKVGSPPHATISGQSTWLKPVYKCNGECIN